MIMATFEGDFSPPDGRFAIVVARFNALVTESLLSGCRDAFVRHGVPETGSTWPGCPARSRSRSSPGSWPRAAATRPVVCLGCVIRGETGHYDHVAGQAAAGCSRPAWRPACRSSSASSPPRRSSRR